MDSPRFIIIPGRTQTWLGLSPELGEVFKTLTPEESALMLQLLKPEESFTLSRIAELTEQPPELVRVLLECLEQKGLVRQVRSGCYELRGFIKHPGQVRLAARLLVAGIDRETVARLLEYHEPEKIEKALETLHYQMKKGEIRDPGRYLQAILRGT